MRAVLDKLVIVVDEDAIGWSLWFLISNRLVMSNMSLDLEMRLYDFLLCLFSNMFHVDEIS